MQKNKQRHTRDVHTHSSLTQSTGRRKTLERQTNFVLELSVTEFITCFNHTMPTVGSLVAAQNRQLLLAKLAHVNMLFLDVIYLKRHASRSNFTNLRTFTQ